MGEHGELRAGSEPVRRPRCAVLVVEDDPGTRAFLAAALAKGGFELGVAPSGDSALAELERSPYQVVLVDIGLPGISGFELVAEIRRQNPDVVVALMSADARVDVAVRALRSDVDDFIAKPIAPQALVQRIERLAHRRQSG